LLPLATPAKKGKNKKTSLHGYNQFRQSTRIRSRAQSVGVSIAIALLGSITIAMPSGGYHLSVMGLYSPPIITI